MFDVPGAIKAVAGLFDDALNAAFPTPEAKASAAAIQMKAASDAAIATMNAQMAIPLAEAQSQSFFTSGARPGLMWTMYALILWGIPFSIIAAIRPELATAMASGFGAWLKAVPDQLWEVFGWCFSAYTLGRTADKGLPLITKK